MALRREKLFALKWGEGAQKAAAAYYGGHPLMVSATGFDIAAAPANVIGISANSAGYDAKYNGKVTYYLMPCMLTLFNGDLGIYGTPEIVDDYPYDTTLAWVIGDKIYWDGTAKKWIRTAATSGDPAYGTVLEVGASASYLVIQFERI